MTEKTEKSGGGAAETRTHSGGCHCGKVRYAVDIAGLSTVMSCNCSICSKRGWLLTFVPADQFRLLSGEGDLIDYQFNKHAIHHLFCSTCGTQSFGRGVVPGSGKEMVAINARCLDDVDPGKLTVKHFDGRSL